jgi:tyrosine-protein phosphatase YwqE
LINEVLGLGVPVQVTGDVLARRWKRRSALELMGAGCPVVVASDCHRVDSRPPVIGAALDVLEKKRGIAYVEAMLRCANKLAGG